MSKEVKRYIATRTLPAASEWNSSTVPHTYVRASDYDALLAERDALKDALAEARSSLEYIGRLSIEVGDYAKTKSGCARAALQGEQP